MSITAVGFGTHMDSIVGSMDTCSSSCSKTHNPYSFGGPTTVTQCEIHINKLATCT